MEHVRADGFTWRPSRPVHWLACDMVTAPARVAKLVGLWGARRLFREAVFNLKLPSGRRLDAVLRSAGIVARELGRAGVSGELRVITSYSIHYTKLYEVPGRRSRRSAGPRRAGGPRAA